MNTVAHRNFRERTARIDRNHRKLARGAILSVGHDGLIVARPRTIGPSVPWKGIALLCTGFFLFKVALVAVLGPADYDGRVALLKEGTVIEQLGSVLMTAGPVTQMLASEVSALF